jgi:diguanylate cyclase (GGDEF)-like protein
MGVGAEAAPASAEAKRKNVATEDARPPPEDRLPIPGKTYLACVYGLAVGAAAVSFAVRAGGPDVEELLAFGLLTALTAASQLFKVDAPNRHSYHATPALLLAATLLLQPWLLVALVVLAMLPEWVRYRYPWYIQSFNIATYLLNVLAAWAVFHLVGQGEGLVASWRQAGAIGLSALTFTALNHLMVVLVLWFARGIRPGKSGILTWDSILTDMALLFSGAVMAALWVVSPPVIVLGVVPLFLFYRALSVPQLQEEAYYDAKTGLLSARRSLELIDEELAKILKTPRPTAVIMADLDLLREVNNSLGHLAGDEVLQAVAGTLRSSLRGDDVVGRFGGEEFVILLRHSDAETAQAVAERLRAAVEAAEIQVSGREEPVRITMSFGIAAFPTPCGEPDRLLHEADLAVYESKINGRNRVTLAYPKAEGKSPEGANYWKTLESLMFALEGRGVGFDDQTLKVAAMSLALAREMGIAEGTEGWNDIERGSLLHDVGRVAIPHKVLHKKGPLSPDEWEEVRQHPEVGWAMLQHMERLRGAAEVVRAHHEHFDGSGYPQGLAGEQIPLGARIFAVADAFNAITSDRPYRVAQPESMAVEEIVRNRGTQFDPDVVDALTRVLGQAPGEGLEEGAIVRGNSGRAVPSLSSDAGAGPGGLCVGND